MARVRHDDRFWKERIERWSSSGLSARDFASREGVSKERLFFWKRRLRESVAVAVAGVSFAKVAIQASRMEPKGEPLELVTRSGHTVRVSAHFDEAVLLRLLSVLGGP